MLTFIKRSWLVAALFVLPFGVPQMDATPVTVKTIPLGPQPPFSFPEQMVANPGTNRLYVFNGPTPSNALTGPPLAAIAVIDTIAGAIVSRISVPVPPGMSVTAQQDVRNGVKGVFDNPATNRTYVAT